MFSHQNPICRQLGIIQALPGLVEFRYKLIYIALSVSIWDYHVYIIVFLAEAVREGAFCMVLRCRHHRVSNIIIHTVELSRNAKRYVMNRLPIAQLQPGHNLQYHSYTFSSLFSFAYTSAWAQKNKNPFGCYSDSLYSTIRRHTVSVFVFWRYNLCSTKL